LFKHSVYLSDGQIVQMAEKQPDLYPRMVRVKHLHEIPPYKSILELRGNLPPYPLQPDKAMGDPSVIPLMTLPKMDFTSFNCRWQLYQYKVLLAWIRRQKPRWTKGKAEIEARHVFQALMSGDTAYTNKNGPDDGKIDCINKSGHGEYIKRFPVVSAGSYYQVLQAPESIGGMQRSRISMFDGSKDPPSKVDLSDPRLFMSWIETRIPQDGKRVVRPFEYRTTDYKITGDSTWGYPVVGLVARADFAWIESARLDGRQG
jgi:hypothetical protein